jgi:uncharacterized Zn finger protein (UPF0148 family)
MKYGKTAEEPFESYPDPIEQDLYVGGQAGCCPRCNVELVEQRGCIRCPQCGLED